MAEKLKATVHYLLFMYKIICMFIVLWMIYNTTHDIRRGIREGWDVLLYLYGKIISKLVYYPEYEITGSYEY